MAAATCRPHAIPPAAKTGTGATADLTVTTDAMVSVGDIVVVEGQLATNKDFGAGYTYTAIVEKAKVTKE